MAATYTKPVKTPDWNLLAANRVEPLAAKKDLGHAVAAIPISGEENWRASLVNEWMQWFDERMADGASTDENDFDLLDPGNAEPMIRFGQNKIVLVPENGALNPRVDWHTDDYIEYDRIANDWTWYVANVERMKVDANEVTFSDPDLSIDFNGGNPELRFDVGDSFRYSRGANQYEWRIGASQKMRLENVGGRLVAGVFASTSVATQPLTDRYEVHQSNTITARVQTNGGGGLLAGREFNIVSVARTANGRYTITLTDPSAAGCPLATVTNNSKFVNAVQSAGNITMEVRTDAGNYSDNACNVIMVG